MKITTAIMLPIIIPIAILFWLGIGFFSFMYWVTGDERWL
jgi:hypothetical protein